MRSWLHVQIFGIEADVMPVALYERAGKAAQNVSGKGCGIRRGRVQVGVGDDLYVKGAAQALPRRAQVHRGPDGRQSRQRRQRTKRGLRAVQDRHFAHLQA